MGKTGMIMLMGKGQPTKVEYFVFVDEHSHKKSRLKYGDTYPQKYPRKLGVSGS